MAWNLMQVELGGDQPARPLFGTGGMTRLEALAEVQTLLDHASGRDVGFAHAAHVWRRGATNDTLTVGRFVWAVYEHPDGEDPHRAGLTWLEKYTRTLRGADHNGHATR